MARLYDRIRREEWGAWDELRAEVIRQLVRWIRRHLDVGRLPPWELEEIAGEALVEVGLRLKDIPAWPQAWEYARKVGLTMVLRRVRAIRLSRVVTSEVGLALDPIDPTSPRSFQRTDFFDELATILDRLNAETVDFLLHLSEVVLDGDPTLTEIAKDLGMCERSLRSRLRRLQSYCFRLR